MVLVVFLMSVSMCSLPVHRSFYIFSLCIVTLLNLFISSRSFLKDSLGLSIQTTMLSNRENFTILILIYMPLILFSCLITLTQISSIMLNKSNKNRHLCFFSNLREKAFSISLLNIMLAVGFVPMPFIKLKSCHLFIFL